MKLSTVNPTVAYLAGALHAFLLGKGHAGFALKVVETHAGIDDQPTGFEVIFASGLRVAVKVEVLEEPAR